MDFKESYLNALRAGYTMDYLDENVLDDILRNIEDDISTLENLREDLDIELTGEYEVEKYMKDYGLITGGQE